MCIGIVFRLSSALPIRCLPFEVQLYKHVYEILHDSFHFHYVKAQLFCSVSVYFLILFTYFIPHPLPFSNIFLTSRSYIQIIWFMLKCLFLRIHSCSSPCAPKNHQQTRAFTYLHADLLLLLILTNHIVTENTTLNTHIHTYVKKNLRKSRINHNWPNSIAQKRNRNRNRNIATKHH